MAAFEEVRDQVSGRGNRRRVRSGDGGNWRRSKIVGEGNDRQWRDGQMVGWDRAEMHCQGRTNTSEDREDGGVRGLIARWRSGRRTRNLGSVQAGDFESFVVRGWGREGSVDRGRIVERRGVGLCGKIGSGVGKIAGGRGCEHGRKKGSFRKCRTGN